MADDIVDAHAASDRQVFVDMFGRFDPATELLHAAIADGGYGALKALDIEVRSALLWEGYDIRLRSIAHQPAMSLRIPPVLLFGVPVADLKP